MNKGRQLPCAAIVQTHFDKALAADGDPLLFLNHQARPEPGA